MHNIGDTIICDEDKAYPKESLFVIGYSLERLEGIVIKRYKVVRRIELKHMPFFGHKNSVMKIRKDSYKIIKGINPRLLLLERKYV